MAGVPAWSDAGGRVLAVDHDDAGRFELRVTAQRTGRDRHPSRPVTPSRSGCRDGVREVALEPLAGGTAVDDGEVADGRADLSLAGPRAAPATP